MIWVAALLAVLLLLVACGSEGEEKEVTIKCDGCDVVQLWETSHATRVVGEMKPGDTGVATDKAWSALESCMFYYVAAGDQEGWVCEEYLEFK